MTTRMIDEVLTNWTTKACILPVNLAWQWRQSVLYHKMGSFCIYKQLKRISILCYGKFMESAILHNIRCLSFSVVYKCRRIPSHDLKYTLTSLSSKVDREYCILFRIFRESSSLFLQTELSQLRLNRSKSTLHLPNRYSFRLGPVHELNSQEILKRIRHK